MQMRQSGVLMVNNIQRVLLKLCVFFALMSVLDSTNSIFQARLLRYVAVGAFTVLVLKQNNMSIEISRFSKIFLVFVGYLVFSLILTRIFYDFKGFGYLYVAFLPLLLYVVIYNCEDYIFEDFESIVKLYVLLAIIMALVTIVSFDRNAWLAADQYSYSAGSHKNLIGQILGTAIVIIIFAIKKESLREKIIWFSSSGIIAVAMLYVQCRSALIAVAVCGLVYILFVSHHKVRDIFFLVLFIVVIQESDLIMEMINHSLFIDKYSVDGQLNVDKFSSGRLDLWGDAWEVFLQFPIIGSHAYYVDNFWLNLLTNTGLLGTLICVPLFVMRIQNAYIYFKNSNNDILGISAIMVLAFSLTISMFEAYPPFGPGVSAIMFWITAAFVDKKLALL